MEFQVNQIVRGAVCGYFVILAFRNDVSSETCVQVKSVNPNDFSEVAPGEFALPISAIKPID